MTGHLLKGVSLVGFSLEDVGGRGELGRVGASLGDLLNNFLLQLSDEPISSSDEAGRIGELNWLGDFLDDGGKRFLMVLRNPFSSLLGGCPLTILMRARDNKSWLHHLVALHHVASSCFHPPFPRSRDCVCLARGAAIPRIPTLV